MKISSRARSFVLLVKHDLLALSDPRLFHLIQHWMTAAAQAKGLPDENLHTIRVALGYTHEAREPCSESILKNEHQAIEPWQPPTPPRLRLLLTDMDTLQFLQCVIPLAFRSLHGTHPEWGEGMLFQAHLANYLRQQEQKPRSR
jgi:hypothetical protein